MRRDTESGQASGGGDRRRPQWKGWSLRTVAPAPRQASCALGGEAVVLQLDSGVYFGLDEVGALVWERVRRPGGLPTVTDLRDLVLAAFEVDAPTCQEDLLELLVSMQRAGLVEVRGGDPG